MENSEFSRAGAVNESNLDKSPPGVLLYGTSGHSKVVADVIQMQGCYKIEGYLDDTFAGSLPGTHLGLPLLGGRTNLLQLREDGYMYIVPAFGDCHGRLAVVRAAVQSGFQLATAIHPRATVALDTEIGPGTVIVAGAVINSGAVVGMGAIINTGAGVDHDCMLEDCCHVGPGVHIGGGVRIGQCAWLGIGSVIKDGVHIGTGSIVGAGSIVLRDLPENVVAYGQPARVVRSIERGI